jgi:DNA-binding NarL/FixJ family response regulator
METSIRVVVIDDHDLVREGLRSVLGHHDDLRIVGAAATPDEAHRVVHETEPDLVLLDLRLGEHDGIDVARRLRASDVEAKILILSVHDTPRDLRTAIAAGADGYLLKSVSGAALADGIRRAVAGETVIGEEFVPKLLQDASRRDDGARPEVTAREQEVLELVAAGLGDRAVAQRLEISTRTAQKHVENLFRKVGVHDRVQLVAHAVRQGLVG